MSDRLTRRARRLRAARHRGPARQIAGRPGAAGRAVLFVLLVVLPIAFLLVTLSAAASTVTSISPRVSLLGAHESFAGLTTITAYAVLFFATRSLVVGQPDARVLLLAPVIAATVAGAYGVVQLVGLDPLAWRRTSEFGGVTRLFATMGHPNFLAAYLVMVLPLGLAFLHEAVLRRRWFVAAVLGLSTALSLVAIGASVSRGAWLALAVALIVIAVGYFGTGERRGVAAVTVATAGLFLALGLVTVLMGRQDGVVAGVAHRAQHLFDADNRWHIWTAALRLFWRQPVFGAGLDAFQLAFAGERTVDYWLVEWNGSPAKAHNELLHVLATQGLLGAVAALGLTMGLAVALIRAVRRAETSSRPWLVALAAGVAGFYVQNLVSFTVVGCGALAVVLAAIASRLASDPHDVESVPR